MNTRMLVPLVLVPGLVAGLARGSALDRFPASPPLTEAQKASICQEVRPVTRDWTQAVERADAMAVLAFYGAIPDFPLMYGDSDGRLRDFEGLQKSLREGFDGVVRYEVILRKEMYAVLDADTVLWGFQGGWRGTLKSGALLQTEPWAVTLLLKRMGTAWKIVYQHESYPQPVETKSANASEKGM